MPTAARRQRDRDRERTVHGHKVTSVREGWNANPEAVALLCAALGYPTHPPATITSPWPDSCRFRVLP